METLECIIAQHPFFRHLEAHYTQMILGCASNVRFKAGEYIFREGDEAHEFYLIREGTVALEISAPLRKPIVVETLNEGDILGWSWLLPPYIWKFNAHATSVVQAIALDGKGLRTRCEENHDLGYALLNRFAQIIERRLEATRYQLLDIYAAV